MFLYNNWYVAAIASEVTSEAPLARRICGIPIVMFRTPEGKAAVLEDRCIHRGMPLSHGKVCDKGRTLQCPYHGLEFDSSGACTKAPGQEKIPPAMRVLTYPVVERDAMVWLWPGDPALADPDQIPVMAHGDDPAWELFGQTHIEFKANWQLILDNLMDMNHIAYVHVVAINGDPDAHVSAKMTVSTDDENNRVEIKRQLPNSNPPAQYKFGCDFKGKVDRWQEFEFCPSGVQFCTGAVDAGTGAYEGRREGGVQLRHFHAITPVDEGSSHYFFYGLRNFALGNDLVAAKLKEGMLATLNEDRGIIESQQARLNETPDRPLVSLAADSGGLQVRRVLKRLLAAQAQTRPVPHHAGSAADVDAMLQNGVRA